MMIDAIPAPAPFDHPEADVILRSSDKDPVDFRIFKLLLSLSSPFFTEIFTLPQPPPSAPSSPYSGEYVDTATRNHRRIPIVQMAEDKETLQLFLGLCLPVSFHPQQPHFSSLHQIQKVAEAAIKFETSGIQAHLKSVLVSPRLIESQPLRAFAIAYRYGWDVEARKAARYTLRHPHPMSATTPSSFVTELEYISAATFYRLQEYHRICGEVASSRVMLQPALAEADGEWSWVTCKRCPAAFNQNNNNWWSGARTRYPDVRKWWVQWIEDTAKEMQARPWGETVRKFDLMNKAIEQAGTCTNCGPRARQDLEGFTQILAVEIERDISSVDLDIKLDDWSCVSPT